MNKNRGLLLCICLSGVFHATAGDWPNFRGPDFNGIVGDTDVFKGEFSFEINWKRELGSGYACIAIADGTAVTMYSDETTDWMIAFDPKTGKEQWRYEFGPVYKGHSGSQDGPSSTPTIHEGIVYGLDPYGKMVALNLADGKKLWGYHLGEDLPARVPHYGFNTVPLVLGDAVILMTGDDQGKAFTALDRKTGKQLWTAGNDTTTYQSPIIWERDGKKRILAVTDHNLMELDPDDGKVLWQSEHKVLDNESYAMPVLYGKDKVLILSRKETAAFQLEWPDGKGSLKEIWRSNVFSRTYALPIYHEGYLYGFRSQFLSCVNAETGEVKWRSRPPGGQGLMFLDGQLLIVSKDGDLVAVEATSEAYRETSRAKLFDQGSYSTATYVDGTLYLRNLKEMASVRIVEGTAGMVSAVPEKQELKGAFGAFVKKVQQASNKQELIDAYMKEQKTFPIIEEKGLVHFVYQGDVSDVALTRGFVDDGPLERVAGTNLFFKTMELDLAGHWNYHFNVFGDKISDPLNPLVMGSDNELRMPNWQAPDYLGEPKGPRGKLENVTFKSTILANEREVKLYLPPGYGETDARYPLLVVIEQSALDDAKMDVALDNLIGKQIAPLVVAFVSGNRAETMGDKQAEMISMLSDELIPHLESAYRLAGKADQRGIMGAARGAVFAAHAAFKRPDAFGRVALQSFIFTSVNEPAMKKLIAETDASSLSAYVVISTNDIDFPGFQAEASSRELVKLMGEKGYKVASQTTAGAASWGNWRGQTGNILKWFAPIQSKSDM